jgi:hypothetical protein
MFEKLSKPALAMVVSALAVSGQLSCLADTESSGEGGSTSATVTGETQSGGVTPLYAGGNLINGRPAPPETPDPKVWGNGGNKLPGPQFHQTPHEKVQNYSRDQKTGQYDDQNHSSRDTTREINESLRKRDERIHTGMPAYSN